MIGEVQFWLANMGLIGMALFHTLANTTLSTVFGLIEVFSVFLFLYNMLATLLKKMEGEA